MEIIKAIAIGFGAMSSAAVIALAVATMLAYQKFTRAGAGGAAMKSPDQSAMTTDVQLTPKFGDNLTAKAEDGEWHPGVVTDVDGGVLTVAVYVGDGKFELWDIPVDTWGLDWKWPGVNRAAVS